MECIVCQKWSENDDVSFLSARGLDTLRESAESRNDEVIKERLIVASKSTTGKTFIHNSCRRKYNDKRSLSQLSSVDSESKRLRSSVTTFNWREDCFICGDAAVKDVKHPERCPVRMVETLSLKQTIVDLCDVDNHPVRIRLNSEVDLVAAEARYHHNCLTKFIHGSSKKTDQSVGRPINNDMDESFNSLCNWLENDGEAELYTLSELHDKMSELAGDSGVYTEKYTRIKLQQHYGEHVFFASVGGSRKDVVCFKDMASFIISDRWYTERKSNARDECHRIFRSAAELQKEEIRAMPYSKDSYPAVEDYHDVKSAKQFLPDGLSVFLDCLVSDELKSVALGHAIVQGTRPRSVISPILFGLGVEFHHMFGSEWAVNQLHSLGYSVSYDEVTRFRQSVIQNQTIDSLPSPPYPVLTQFGADNVDSNVKTLDGYGTLHGMGHFAWHRKAHETDLARSSRRVKRKAIVTVDRLIGNKEIPIMKYITATIPVLSTETFVPLHELMLHASNIPARELYANVLWKLSFALLNRGPEMQMEWINWSGFMQKVHKADVADVDETTLLPIIDLNSGNEDCILPTLTYVSNQTSRLQIPTTTVTFDQPLYIKACEIAATKRISNVVIRLGGFHLVISATGSLYATMRGSGIEDALGQIYATNSIPHLLSGKAISRALRGTRLLSAAL